MARNKFEQLIFGTRPEDVQLPGNFETVRKRREQLVSGLEREGPSTAASEAAKFAAKLGLEDLRAREASRVAGTRGFGQLAAARQAAQATTQGAQGLQAQIQQGLLRARVEDLNRDRQRQQFLAQLLGEQERSALTEAQLREEQKRKGLLGTLTGIAGGIAGGYAGGPAGQRAGQEFGTAYGDALSNLY